MVAGQTLESTTAALRAAVDCVGSQSAMGRLLGLSQASVSKWVRLKKPLPAEHVLTVERATGISRHDLRPDLYPRESHPAPEGAAPDRYDGARS